MRGLIHHSALQAAAIALVAVLAGTSAAHAGDAPVLERWRSYSGVSWDNKATAAGRTPSRFANSVNAPIAGLHFDTRGRAFVSTPRLVSADAPATLSILDTTAKSGPARLTAFPSQAANAVAGPVGEALRNVLGFYVDRHNQWLWALDMGFVAGEKAAPEGAQKLLVIDLRTGRTVKAIALDGVADRSGSFLNDVAVDERRKVAYIADSGMRSAPDNQVGLIVVDFANGQTRRVLDRHASLQIEPGVKVVSHGEEVWSGNPLLLGVNGVALSPDGQTLYWTVTTGTRLRAVPTALLRDAGASDAVRAAAIRDLGAVGGNTDGIVADAAGRVYITDVTRNGIVRYEPATGTLALLAADEGVQWPDTPAIGPEGALYFTSSHLNHHFAGAVKAGEERYELWRLPFKQARARARTSP